MATQTENYKLNKPARTDKIDIDLLNENMDIIDDQLGKAGYYELDLRDVTDFTVIDGEKIQGIDITEYVNADELFTAAANGRLIRLRTKDSATSSVICALLTDYTDYSDNSNTIRVIQGTYWYETTSGNLSHFQIIQLGSSVRLRWLDAKESGGGTVKTVNGVEPDENGNVQIPIATEEPGTTKLDFSNWSNGSFTEHFDDGTSEAHPVVRDGTGAITSIGGITIVGVG